MTGMSAVIDQPLQRFVPMTPSWVDAVLAIEQGSYTHPWTRRNFTDSIASGYLCELLLDEHDRMLGYFVAMKGVDEVHLLNITVAPDVRGRGFGVMLLDALALWSRRQGAQWLWLEVRQSNVAAIRIYERYGFRRVGLRKDYYPAARGQREHAVVMSCRLS
jgi:ribosomal-protein-alanine N-acetyltransferase